MNHTKAPHWEAAKSAMTAGKSSLEVLGALFNADHEGAGVAAIKTELDKQREPDITIHARHCTAYVLRRDDASDEQVYESLREVAERSLPKDEPMHEINARLRRELDVSEKKLREQQKQVGDLEAELHKLRERLAQL